VLDSKKTGIVSP